MANRIKMSPGDKYGILTIMEELPKTTKRIFLCRCVCGKEKIVIMGNLRNGHTRSCGCLNRYNSITHGMRYTRFYAIWKSMNGRCYSPSHASFKSYGLRGITSEWRGSFEKFKNDMYESYLDHVKDYGVKQTTLDRINNSGNYSKDNCRWATYMEQNNNKTFPNGYGRKTWEDLCAGTERMA